MKGQAIKYTAAELEYIKSRCTDDRRTLLADFNAKFGRDIALVNLNSLCKRRGWLTGRNGQYKKGNIPHPNARPKGPNKTSFKKGQKPLNWKPVGSTRVSKDGYVEIKTSEPRTWRHLHVVLWEQNNGPVPDGHCVTFADFDATNVCLENLELVTRSELLHMNRLKLSQQHKEIQPTVKALAKLMAKTFAVQGERNEAA